MFILQGFFKWDNLLLFISVLVIIFLIIILIFPTYVGDLNDRVGRINNLVSYLSLLFTVCALVVALLAYKSANLKPDLSLDIIPYDYAANDLVLHINESTKEVSITRPGTEWSFDFTNKGKVSANNPVVRIIFSGAYFSEDTFDGWAPVVHHHGLGWCGFEWSGKEDGNMLHPDFPVRLPTMYFSGEHIIGDAVTIKILIAADNTPIQSYELPVKLNKVDFD